MKLLEFGPFWRGIRPELLALIAALAALVAVLEARKVQAEERIDQVADAESLAPAEGTNLVEEIHMASDIHTEGSPVVGRSADSAALGTGMGNLAVD